MTAGLFDSYWEDPSLPTELLGYYPAFFYSQKTFIIPEILNRSILPPVSLKNHSGSDSYLQFLARNFDLELDSYAHFSLGPTQLQLDVPQQALSFYFYFDLVSSPNNDFLGNFVRFNLAEFSFIFRDANDNHQNLFVISIDLAFKSEGLVQAGSGDAKVHVGKLRVVLNHSVAGGAFETVNSDFDVVKGPASQTMQVANVPGAMYSTQYDDDFGRSSVLSGQVLVLRVSRWAD